MSPFIIVRIFVCFFYVSFITKYGKKRVHIDIFMYFAWLPTSTSLDDFSVPRNIAIRNIIPWIFEGPSKIFKCHWILIRLSVLRSHRQSHGIFGAKYIYRIIRLLLLSLIPKTYRLLEFIDDDDIQIAFVQFSTKSPSHEYILSLDKWSLFRFAAKCENSVYQYT